MTPNTVAKCRISQYLSNRLGRFNFTFGFVRGSEGVVRVVVNMDNVASNELSNLIRLRIVLEVHFTCAVRLVHDITILIKHVQLTLDYVYDSWAMVVCGDRHADGKLTESCH